MNFSLLCFLEKGAKDCVHVSERTYEEVGRAGSGWDMRRGGK